MPIRYDDGMRKGLCLLLILLLALSALSAETKALTYYSVLDEESPVSVPVEWKIQNQKDSSSGYDDNLAKAAVCLARSIYVSEEALQDNLKKLGYSKIEMTEETEVSKPLAAFGHQKKSGINYYVIVVRGTASFQDFLTDLKSFSDYFMEAGDETEEAFLAYCSNLLKKDEKTLKKEKNVFFVVGHSLGAAVANHLSENLLKYTSKEQIFTYTFESPSTGVDEGEAGCSNAINIINASDFVPDLPFPEGRFGKDLYYWPDELDPEIYFSVSGKELETIEGFTIINKWDNHLLDCSLTYVLSREQGKLRTVED